MAARLSDLRSTQSRVLCVKPINVRLGSNPEVRGLPKFGPFCGVERTSNIGMSAYRLKAVV